MSPSILGGTDRSVGTPNRGDATLPLSQIGRSSGVDWPQKRHKPRTAKQSRSEPTGPSSLTLATSTSSGRWPAASSTGY